VEVIDKQLKLVETVISPTAYVFKTLIKINAVNLLNFYFLDEIFEKIFKLINKSQLLLKCANNYNFKTIQQLQIDNHPND
jgi:hypothetical protein